MLRDLSTVGEQPDIEIFMTTTGTEDESSQIQNAYVDPFDDVFGSAPSSPITDTEGDHVDFSNAPTSRPSDHPSDVSRLRSIHVTNGYREGIAASKEKHIQEGFDEGYSLGAEVALKAGRIVGSLEGLWHALANQKTFDDIRGTSDCSQKAVQLHEEVATLLKEAEEELKVHKLFSRQYFGEDGVWIYDVPDQEDEGEVSFARVAEAHPMIKMWDERIEELCGRLGLPMG